MTVWFTYSWFAINLWGCGRQCLDSFLLSVKNTSWESTVDANDTCESYMRFHNNLKIAIDKSFPFVKIRNKVVNNTKNPWMTNGIFKSISKKNKLYKKFLKKPTRKNETDYKKYNNKLKNGILHMTCTTPKIFSPLLKFFHPSCDKNENPPLKEKTACLCRKTWIYYKKTTKLYRYCFSLNSMCN